MPSDEVPGIFKCTNKVEGGPRLNIFIGEWFDQTYFMQVTQVKPVSLYACLEKCESGNREDRKLQAAKFGPPQIFPGYLPVVEFIV